MNQWVITTNDQDFAQAVLARSREVPVIVDFWAPWCGPCRTLTPMVEKLAEEYAGKFWLAKVNIDDNPALAAQFRIQSIPRLIAFKDGRPALDVVGAVPAAELRRFVDQVVPGPAEQLVRQGEEALSAGQAQAAEPFFQQALGLEPRHGRALIGLAAVMAERGDFATALDLLERVPALDQQREAADRLAAKIRVRGNGQGDEASLRERIAAAPDDLQARFDFAQALATADRYEAALEQLLEILRRDRDFAQGAARKAMLDIFEVLGAGSPLTESYRNELAKVLFS